MNGLLTQAFLKIYKKYIKIYFAILRTVHLLNDVAYYVFKLFGVYSLKE